LTAIVYDTPLWNRIALKISLPSSILAAVFYAGAAEPAVPITPIPYLQHIVGASSSPSTQTLTSKSYYYPAERSSKFAIPGLEDFHYSAEAVSHTRNLTFIKKYIRGADFDLEAIWEEHTYFEFEDRSVPKTMATMVQEPYVNHIPTVRIEFSLVV
jgi:carboxymethylenebutenolidase